ncbi:TRAP transporter small permease subunit [Mesorhizobium sp.]|uniref:TRAP transporter small permease n=1 Tax=Mesorhizobium sp. TaxID=1871066 RepID=UPI000FE7D9F5|nr:TRAP transporter small permease subunit [Mesorhizobium sp.]RWI88927.1 MAG: TRAP transporter small permease [Mesorhizobium sp.]
MPAIPSFHVLQLTAARTVSTLVLLTYVVACTLLLLLVVVLSLQVFYRYVLQAPLAWSEEAARFALVWLSMTAACLAAHNGDHFVFRWGTLLLPERPRRWVRFLVDLLVTASLAVVFYESVRYLNVVAGKTAAGTGLNGRVPYLGVTVGSGVLMLIYLGEAADGIFSYFTGHVCSRRELQETSIASEMALSDAHGERAP